MKTRKFLGFTLSLLMLVNVFAGLGVFSVLAESSSNVTGAEFTPVTDKAQVPSGSLIAGLTPTKADGSTISTAKGTKLSNLTDGGVQGLDQTISYYLTQNAMSNNGSGSYYNWIAPTELKEMLGKDTIETWYIQDNNTQWWKSNVYDTAGMLYGQTDCQIVYDLGTTATINQLFIASSTEIGDGITNGNTEGPNVECAWSVVQAQMAITYSERYALVCHVYVGDTKANVFDAANEVMSFDWQASADNAKALRNLFTLSETAEGRYVGFDFTDADCVSGFVRLSELGVYGSLKAQNVLLGKQPIAAETTTKWYNPNAGYAVSSTKTDLTEIVNGSGLTNGVSGDEVDLFLPGCNPLTDSNAHTNGSVKLYFDLGGIYSVSQVDITTYGATYQRLYKGTVYMADTSEELFESSSAVFSFDKGCKVNPDEYMSFATENATGRYVGFSFYAPNAAECSWSGWPNGRVLASELAVYGVPFERATGYAVDTTNADKAIPAEDNVLRKAQSIQWTGNVAGAETSVPTIYNKCFDGVMGGVNSAYSESMCDCPIGTHEYMMLTVDMGRVYEFGSFMLAGSGTGNYGVEGFSLYINNLPNASMVANDAYEPAYSYNANVTNGYRVDLTEPLSGRYVHVLCRLKVNAGSWQMWISELAAETVTKYTSMASSAAEAAANADKNLLTKVPVLKPDATSLNTITDGNTGALGVPGAIAEPNTDDLDYKCYVPGTDTLIQGTTGWSTLKIHLATDVTIDSFLVMGSPGDNDNFEAGGPKYRNRTIAYYKIYVSDSPEDLFNEENCVVVCNNVGDNTLSAGTVPNSQVAYKHYLEKPIKATCIGLKGTAGAYNAMRVGEFHVYGDVDTATYTTVAEASVPAVKDNLLADVSDDVRCYTQSGIASGVLGALESVNHNGLAGNFDTLFDGAVWDSNNDAATKWVPMRGDSYIWLDFDLGMHCTIDSVFHAAADHGADRVDFFITDKSVSELVAEGVTPDAMIVGNSNPGEGLNHSGTAVNVALSTPVTGSHVIVRLRGAFNAGAGATARQCWISELSVSGSVAEATAYKGAGLRLSSGSTSDLRFKFNVGTPGAGFADESYAINGNYGRDITNATVKVDGVDRKVLGFGAMVTNLKSGWEASLDNITAANGKTTKVVEANKLYDVNSHYVSYTVVVTGIPAGSTSRVIHARPYVAYEAEDGTTQYVYGEIVGASVESLLL